MITKSRIQAADKNGVQTFTVSEQLTLPLLTSSATAAGTTKTLPSGAKINGEKVRAQILKKEGKGWQPYGDAVGVKIPHEEGYFLVPIDKVTWDSDKWNGGTQVKHSADGEVQVEEVTDAAQNEIAAALSNPDEKRYFGFSAKQLLVIAGIVFVVTKLSK